MNTSPSLFDVIDSMSQVAHATRSVAPLLGTQEPPVTPDPTPEERRDQGIKQATDHANTETPKWSGQADAYAAVTVERRGFKPFLFEELVEASERDGVPKAPDRRAWGGVARRLAKAGIIRKMGYGPAKTSNTSPKVLWCKAIAMRD